MVTHVRFSIYYIAQVISDYVLACLANLLITRIDCPDSLIVN